MKSGLRFCRDWTLISLIAGAPIIAGAYRANQIDMIKERRLETAVLSEQKYIPETKQFALPFSNQKQSRTYNNKKAEQMKEWIEEDMSLPSYINADFLNALISQESNGNRYAQSNKGAKGLMQLTSQAWKQVAPESDFYTQSFNQDINFDVGVKYLLWLNNYFEKECPHWSRLSEEQKQKLIIAAYNGGPTRLKERKWRIDWMPEETKKHVKKVGRKL